MKFEDKGMTPDALAAADVVVLIPSGLLRFTGMVKSVEIQAETVGQALQLISEKFPLLRTQLFSGDRQLRRFINIVLNSQDIRFLQQEQTPLRSRDVVTILPAIAGG